MPYGELPQSIVGLEEEIQRLWQAEETFRRSLSRREGEPEFVFYEGPPTANGRPGVHHIISRTIKDAVARYRTMTGSHVTRIAGWDTHGLPLEIEAEKQLGISGRADIERLGVGRFTDVCRENLFTYKEDWESFSERIGYWLDYARPYITCSPEYVESVWWALAQIERKGLLYRGHKVLPYCPRCGTGLSSHEVAQGYADRSDPSVHVRFPIEGEEGRFLLVWTTTPWTLVSNVAVAFGPHLSYVEVEHEGDRYVMAGRRVVDVFGEDIDIVRAVSGEELSAIVYRRPFDLAPEYPVRTGRAWAADFVSDDEGTGLVHIAPAFGADDFELGRGVGLPMVCPVDDAGRFVPEVEAVGGMFVKDAEPLLIERLDESGLLVRSGKVRHSYPHCWRCESPLLYMARDSWYVRTTAVRDRLLAHNAAIGWYPPEMGSGRMGEWLENNVDWAISRDRYWGTPLPFWICDRAPEHREVVGSYARLAELAGALPGTFDPHRPEIDELSWSCTADGCGGTMGRVPEVLDAWFDSGSMPFAQWHYPFENESVFAEHFPAHFIAEGVDQTRGWFYSLLAISTILFDEPSYLNVIVNGLILDEAGQKMSKSRGNVVDPWESVGTHGADAIRLYLLATSSPWIPKRWDADAIREINRKLFDTLRSTYRFFAMYAELEGWDHRAGAASGRSGPPAVDRWLLSRLDGLVGDVRSDMDGYDLTRAARRIQEFVLNDMSNWYVRQTRDRFWATGPSAGAVPSSGDAFATLHEALTTCALLLAPLAPFLSDWMYRALVGASVHLADFPEVMGRRDEQLEAEMADVRKLATLGRAAREKAGIRVRQPLSTLLAVVPGGRRPSAELEEILRQELNVKRVVFPSRDADIVRLSAKPEYGRLGPRFGARTPAVARTIAAMGADQLRELRAGKPVRLELDGSETEITPDDVRIVEETAGELTVEAADGYVVGLDRSLTEELLGEGMARELVNRVQRLRRESGLAVSDRIRLAVAGSRRLTEALGVHRDYVAGETLALELREGEDAVAESEHSDTIQIEGAPARVGLTRVPTAVARTRGPTA